MRRPRYTDAQSSAYHHLYDKAAWRRGRVDFLREYPLCNFCEMTGQITAAYVVDHVVAHRGDEELFWDRDNWQPLCLQCHNQTKARIEAGDHWITWTDLDGYFNRIEYNPQTVLADRKSRLNQPPSP